MPPPPAALAKGRMRSVGPSVVGVIFIEIRGKSTQAEGTGRVKRLHPVIHSTQVVTNLPPVHSHASLETL